MRYILLHFYVFVLRIFFQVNLYVVVRLIMWQLFTGAAYVRKDVHLHEIVFGCIGIFAFGEGNEPKAFKPGKNMILDAFIVK